MSAMDFADSPDEAAFRDRARAWLAENPARGPVGRNDPDGIAAGRDWQARKADAGYTGIAWPREWGGQGGSAIQSLIFAEEERRAGISVAINFTIGLEIVVPTILAYGDAATAARFAVPSLRGEHLWCQLLSEPSGGSDMAAARTRAVRDGDDWVVNGQKVWTTGGEFADFGLLLCRTDPEVPKHKGMTMFWVDMRSQGITVQPIHQMTDEAEFSEVFLNDVRIPDSQRIGAEGEGWTAVVTMLMNERLALGGKTPTVMADLLKRLLHLAREMPSPRGGSMLQDGAFRERAADWYVQAQALKHIQGRALTKLSRGDTPGPENSVGKLISALQIQEMSNLALSMMGELGIVDDPALSPADAVFQYNLLHSPARRIAGGTDEILKGILAERVLALPVDLRADKGVAFKDIPTRA